jgi:hypothetical protein
VGGGGGIGGEVLKKSDFSPLFAVLSNLINLDVALTRVVFSSFGLLLRTREEREYRQLIEIMKHG